MRTRLELEGDSDETSCYLVHRRWLVGAAAGLAFADPVEDAAILLGATYHPGLAPEPCIEGIVTDADGSGTQLTPYSAPYDYLGDGVAINAKGERPDFDWVHESSGYTADPAIAGAIGTHWTFGSFGSDFVLHPSIDHGPVPAEGLESTLYGSADGGATWILGVLTDLYAMGFDAASIEDDPSSLWHFSTPVSMISAIAGLAQGGYSYIDGDTEIDAICMVVVPLPTPLTLGGLGLASLAGMSVCRRRR
ncbi:MAG: hypothetical protein H7Y88_05570 [Phycisphaerales bacterium]|nr:hypothetical protein [Phycisphaerales bacterium]